MQWETLKDVQTKLTHRNKNTYLQQEVTHIGAPFKTLQTQLEHKLAQQAKTKARTQYPLLQEGTKPHLGPFLQRTLSYSKHTKKKKHLKQKPSQKAALSLI